MKALTVRQPWAWAIFNGKPIENRTQMWKHRGPLLIHAGARISERGLRSPLVRNAYAWAETSNYDVDECDDWELGAIIGMVDLVDVHHAVDRSIVGLGPMTPPCCDSLWAEFIGASPRPITHLVLENPRPIEPVYTPGRLGLWEPKPDVVREVERRLAAAATPQG